MPQTINLALAATGAVEAWGNKLNICWNRCH